MQRLLTWSVFGVLFFSSVVAFADDVARLNEEGITAFQEGRFEEAAQKFRAAWQIEPEPPLRKNEAIAWFKAGRCEEALEAAASYVSYGENDEEAREDAESVIANCKVELAREAIEAGDFELAEKMLDETRDLKVDEYAREQVNLARLDLAKARDAEPKPVAATEPPPPVDPGGSGDSLQMLGWVLTGTGAALVVSALVYHIVMLTSVASEHEDVGRAGADRARFDELSSELDTARWLVPTLYVLGASTAGVGVYLLLDGGSAERGETPAAMKEHSPTSVVIGVRGKF